MEVEHAAAAGAIHGLQQRWPGPALEQGHKGDGLGPSQNGSPDPGFYRSGFNRSRDQYNRSSSSSGKVAVVGTGGRAVTRAHCRRSGRQRAAPSGCGCGCPRPWWLSAAIFLTGFTDEVVTTAPISHYLHLLRSLQAVPADRLHRAAPPLRCPLAAAAAPILSSSGELQWTLPCLCRRRRRRRRRRHALARRLLCSGHVDPPSGRHLALLVRPPPTLTRAIPPCGPRTPSVPTAAFLSALLEGRQLHALAAKLGLAPSHTVVDALVNNSDHLATLDLDPLSADEQGLFGLIKLNSSENGIENDENRENDKVAMIARFILAF
uniref:Uncharacterized protein n=1 Tax=Oryza meridionalis TaxID=40149 RepID=A0A0E0E4B9_9ORYZ